MTQIVPTIRSPMASIVRDHPQEVLIKVEKYPGSRMVKKVMTAGGTTSINIAVARLAAVAAFNRPWNCWRSRIVCDNRSRTWMRSPPL